jgi:hypothetical protein
MKNEVIIPTSKNGIEKNLIDQMVNEMKKID